MKYHLKAKESDDSQYYKFKSRMISIEDIFKEDVLLLSDMESEGSVVDNEEKLEHDFLKITVLPNAYASSLWMSIFHVAY